MSRQKWGQYGDLSYTTFSQSWPDHTTVWQWRPKRLLAMEEREGGKEKTKATQ